MPDDRFEDDLRRRLRAEGEQVPQSTLTTAELERRVQVRRRERTVRTGGLGLVAAVVVLGGLIVLGSGAFLGAPSEPSPAPTDAAVANPSASPEATASEPPPSPSPSFAVEPSQPIEGPPEIEGRAEIDLGSLVAAGGAHDTLDTPLPGGADYVRIRVDCSGDGPATLRSGPDIVVDLPCPTAPEGASFELQSTKDRRLVIDLEAAAGTDATATTVAIDRDVPVDGFTVPRATITTWQSPPTELWASCGLAVNGGAPETCPDVRLLAADDRIVTVVARDPISVIVPGWAIEALDATVLPSVDGVSDPDATPSRLDIPNFDAEAPTLDTPAPGEYLLRLEFTARNLDGDVFTAPYLVRLMSLGRG